MNRIRFVKILSYQEIAPGGVRSCEFNLGLLPFTEVCPPALLHVRRCRKCGNWVEDGHKTCPSCGAPAPEGRGTRAWKRVQVRLQQLGPQHSAVPDQMIVPQNVDPDECLAEVEAQEYEVDWEESDDQYD